jgi:hypothetical protein
MSLNESIVEDAALEWFLLRSAPLNYGGQVGDQPLLTAISAALQLPRVEEKEREAIRRINRALSGPVLQQECRTLFNLWLPN